MGLAGAYVAVVFLRPENFLVAGWDYRAHQFFLKSFLGELLRAGELPLWVPYFCAGRPFAADPQSGVFYPLHLLYAVLSVEQATALLVILHLGAAGFFCYRLGREVGLSHFGGLVGGLIFMFNGFLVTRGYRGQSERLEAIAFLPLIFFAVERAERKGRWGWYLWAGVAGALQILAGAPQIAWLTWVGLGTYLLARRICFWKPGRVRALAKSVGGGLLALGLTAGLAAVQIVPTAELFGQSNRAAGSLEFSAAFAFAPQKVIHLFFPNFLGSRSAYFDNDPERAGYVGLLGLVLALLGLLRYRGRLKWTLMAVGLLNVLIMLGQATPAFEVLYYLIPGFSAFRIPSRAILMVAFCLALLAGMGAEAVWNQAGQTRTRKLGIALAGAMILAMGAMAQNLVQFTGQSLGEVPALWSALGLAMLALAGTVLPGLGRRAWIQFVWLVLVCLDSFVVGAGAERYRTFEKHTYEPTASEHEIVRQMRAEPGLYRFALPEDLVRQNVGLLAGKSGVNGFISLSLERYYKFVHYMTWQPVPEVFTHTPGEEVFSPDHPFPFKLLNVRYSVGRDPATGSQCLVGREDFVPRAFFVSDWQVLEDEEAVLEAIRSPQFDPRATVLFDEEPGVDFAPGPVGAGNQVEITRYSPGGIVLKADVESDGFLVLSEMYYPGWRAYLDGREAPILRADYLLRAIPLRAGRYERIECRYEPRSLGLGLLITMVSVVALAVSLAAGRLRGRSRLPGAAPMTGEAPCLGPGRGAGPFFRLQITAILAAGLGLPLLLRTHYAICWTTVGGYYANRGEYDQAAAMFERALRIRPDHGEVHFWIGRALMEDRPAEAVDHLRRAVEADPDSAAAHNNLGGVLVRLGEIDEAIDHLRRAVELEPDLSEGHYHWGMALARRGRFADAAEHLSRARALAPGDAELYLQVANLWAAYGQFGRAIPVLREALVRWPESPEFLGALAWQLATCPQEELRDGAEAVVLARRACRQTGRADPRMLLTLGAALAEDGQLRRAIKVARRGRTLAAGQGATELERRLEAMVEDFTRRGGASPHPRTNP